MGDDGLWKLEEKFWHGGENFYADNLHAQCVMLFPEPVGRLNREEILHSISESPRWSEVKMSDQERVDHHANMVLLSYQASARRTDGGGEYLAQIVSVYSNSEGTWKLPYHQHIPQSAAQ